MKKIIAALSLIFTVSCSSKKSETIESGNRSDFIIGGKLVAAKDSLSRFVVGLYDTRTHFMCTGILIRENIVMTAGHCIENNASRIVIVFALNFSVFDKNQVDKIRNAAAVLPHPDFHEGDDSDMDWNDIALVKIDGELPEGYAPASFLSDETLLQPNSTVHMAGYGATGVDLEELTKRDRQFNRDLTNGDIFCADPYKKSCYRVNFLGSDDLRTTQATIEGFTEKEIRLNENKGHGTCVGDSGGPLMVEKGGSFFVVGLTSRGSELCDGPAVYTNALKYQDWIEKSIPLLK